MQKIIDIKCLERFLENIKLYIQKICSNKQDILISGENIKTINGESIIGNGNIDLNKYVDDTIKNSITNVLNTEI